MTSIPALLRMIAQDMQIDMGTASQFMTGWMLAISVATLFLGVVCDKKGLSFALNCGLLISLISVQWQACLQGHCSLHTADLITEFSL